MVKVKEYYDINKNKKINSYKFQDLIYKKTLAYRDQIFLLEGNKNINSKDIINTLLIYIQIINNYIVTEENIDNVITQITTEYYYNFDIDETSVFKEDSDIVIEYKNQSLIINKILDYKDNLNLLIEKFNSTKMNENEKLPIYNSFLESIEPMKNNVDYIDKLKLLFKSILICLIRHIGQDGINYKDIYIILGKHIYVYTIKAESSNFPEILDKLKDTENENNFHNIGFRYFSLIKSILAVKTQTILFYEIRSKMDDNKKITSKLFFKFGKLPKDLRKETNKIIFSNFNKKI
jgi:hypothetical protein